MKKGKTNGKYCMSGRRDNFSLKCFDEIFLKTNLEHIFKRGERQTHSGVKT